MRPCCTSAKKKYRFNSLKLFQLLVVFIFLAVGGNAFAASFSADLVKTGGGKTQTSRLFLLDDLYRLDIVEDGQELTILVNRTSGKTKILIPGDKEYLEIENDSFQSVMNNPLEGYYMMRQRFEARTSGSETIDGIECDKVIISSDGKDLVTAWVAKPYAFPIRMVNPTTGDRAELKNIKEGRIDKTKFQVPAGYTEKEDPAKKREREEAALPFLTTTATGTAPWTRRIGPLGEMRVTVDPEESVRIKFENFIQDESVFTIKGFRAGRPINLDCQRTTFSLQGKGRRDECLVGVQNRAEEIAVTVEKGKIIAHIYVDEKSFFGHEDMESSFFVATGRRDWGQGKFVDPKRQVRLSITSDSQDGTESTIKVTFYKDENKKDKVDETDVVLNNGQSKIWDYPPEKGIRFVQIDVAKGGGVQVRIEQPAPVKKAAAKKQAVKKAPQPKVTDVFTVTHPYGTSKPLAPGKDLVITVTGLAAGAAGTIDLYTDRQKTKKIDTFSFKLKRKQSKSYTVPGSKGVGWATVWVSKKSFTVKLDQSPGAKPPAAPPKKKPNKPVAAGKAKNTPALTVTGEESVVNGMILNGAVPIMDGMKVLKQMLVGPSGQADLEVPADPEAVINFYKKAMTAKGWKPGMAMIQGPMGVLQLTKGKSRLLLQAKASGQKSTVSITLAIK
jgi:hypothetical protein